MGPAIKKLSFRELFLIILLSISLLCNFCLWYLAENLYAKMNLLRQDPLELEKNTLDFKSSKSNQPLLIVLGDSRAKQWKKPAGFEAKDFMNMGIGGQTSTQVLGRYEYHVRPYRPEYLLVQVGINDIKLVGLSLASADSVLEKYRKNIESLIAKTTEDRIRLILTTIFPTAKPSFVRSLFWNRSAGDAVKEFNQYLNSIAMKGVKVYDTARILSNRDGFLKREYAEDFLHFSDAGYQRLNQTLVLSR